jgi:hypothetical protein
MELTTRDGYTEEGMAILWASWRDWRAPVRRLRSIRAAMPGTSDTWVGRKWAATQVW